MRVTWKLPRLLRGAPHNPGPAVPGAPDTGRRMFTPKALAVQGPRRTVELAEREWELLSLLFEYRGSYLTRETILSRIWGPYYVNQDHVLTDTITSLRAAMKRAGYPGDLIHERRDLGYGVRAAKSDGKAA